MKLTRLIATTTWSFDGATVQATPTGFDFGRTGNGEPGRVDQACGLVLRYRDENHYYITRALEAM
jgi:hypothetical protein